MPIVPRVVWGPSVSVALKRGGYAAGRRIPVDIKRGPMRSEREGPFDGFPLLS